MATKQSVSQSGYSDSAKISWSLRRVSLIREVYRSLINTGRSYAAFTDKDKKLIELLKGRREVVDPTSGYGLTTRYCSEQGLRSYCVEFNLPQYLWQVLCQPNRTAGFLSCIEQLLAQANDLPKSTVRARVSDEWYPEESKQILMELVRLAQDALGHFFKAEECILLAVALLTPFSGRLSCCSPGDVSPHVKEGGFCVYLGWEADFASYLRAVAQRLKTNSRDYMEYTHETHHGDVKTFGFPEDRFSGMLTSPPYPNSRDFTSMFKPEHAFLKWLGFENQFELKQEEKHVIGSNFVSGRPKRIIKTEVVSRFITRIGSLDMDKSAAYDEKVYYIPYFENYFADLEDAYANVSKALTQDFEGFIVVVNNTHRNVLVPVSDAVIEIWQNLGFNAEVFEALELFHIGVKNPRARGLRARHTEYMIRVWR